MTSNSKWVAYAIIAAALMTRADGQPLNLQAEVPADARKAAVESLQTFRELAAPENAEKLGLDKPEQAAQAALGNPIQDYLIGLSDLKAWDGRDPGALLRATGQLIFPITTEGATRTSVTVAQIKGTWKAAAFGSPNEARARSEIREKLGGGAPVTAPGTVQVRIPALNAVFVAQQAGGELQFTPIFSVPNLGLEAGKTESAREVLQRLLPAARELNPNVPN
jgi:hypothetical protein